MVFVLTMVTNDNEKFSFITLSAATKRVTDRLSNGQKQTDSEGVDDREADERSKEKAEQHRRYVDEGLKRIRAFERRARGIK